MPSWNELVFPARDLTPAVCIRQLSEVETGPTGENLVSNEDSYPRACGDLLQKAPRLGVYLGVGPDQNFSLIAHSQPSLAWILDFRRRNTLAHLVHKALFALNVDRASYLVMIVARAPKNLPKREASSEELVETFSQPKMDRSLLNRAIRDVRRYLEPLDIVLDSEWSAVATIQSRLAGPGLESRFLGLPGYPTVARMMLTTDRQGRPSHFLARDDLYQAVRQMQIEDRIWPLVGDFAGEGCLRRLAERLRQMRLGISVVYVSDVEFFLLRSGKFAAYIANLASLPLMQGAVIVRTSTRPIQHAERVDGDQSTTVVRDLARFLEDARAGKIGSVDDLF